jgi:hypothetical protein
MTVNNNNPIVTPTASLEDDNDDSNAANYAATATAAATSSRGRWGGELEHDSDECCWLSKLLNGHQLSAMDIERLKDNRVSGFYKYCILLVLSAVVQICLLAGSGPSF